MWLYNKSIIFMSIVSGMSTSSSLRWSWWSEWSDLTGGLADIFTVHTRYFSGNQNSNNGKCDFMDERWTSCFTLVGGNIVLSSTMKGLWVICGGWIGQIKSACQTWWARIFIWDFSFSYSACSHCHIIIIVIIIIILKLQCIFVHTFIIAIVLIFTNHIIFIIIVINGSDDHG